jgi:large subunit ribosomal protein L3
VPEKKYIKEFYNTEFEVNSKFYDQVSQWQPEEPDTFRCGVLAHKVGMTHVWDKWGKAIPLSVLQVDRCQVTQVKTIENDGFSALQVGFGGKSMKRLRKSTVGHLVKAGVPPKLKYTEFKVAPENLLPLGYQLSAWHYTPGQFVDCSTKNKGDGTMGVMKAWNFGGQPASHGVSLAHR